MRLLQILIDLVPLASAIGLVVLVIVLLPPRKKSSQCDTTAGSSRAGLESSRANCELSEP